MNINDSLFYVFLNKMPSLFVNVGLLHCDLKKQTLRCLLTTLSNAFWCDWNLENCSDLPGKKKRRY